MAGFTIERVPYLTCRRVLAHPGDARSVAILDVEADGTLTLFPTAWGDIPAPLTGEIMRFPDLAAVERFLGIAPAEDIAA